jgi:hypothetical protein
MILDSPLAAEAAKPAAGFISALLQPKIDRLSKWVKSKDALKNIEPDLLVNLIHVYENRLSFRVSEVTSVAFPRQKFCIFDVYEPVSVVKYSDYGRNREYVVISEDFLDSEKTYILVDDAGMGKSTFAKHLVCEALLKSDRVPVFFELRRIQEGVSLIESLIRELSYPGFDFPRPVFYKLLELGKLIIVLDGFDEVSSVRQAEVTEMIRDLSIEGHKNLIFLTSRKQDILPDMIQAEFLKFLNLNEQQATSLVKKYDSISKYNIADNLVAQFNHVPDKFLENPLLVILLYKTFSFNGSIAERVGVFYDEIYDALYKGHDLSSKNGYMREKKCNLDFEQFRSLLRSFCFVMVVHKKEFISKFSVFLDLCDMASKNCVVKPKSAELFLNDLIVSVPFMVREGSEYRFIHKTIYEYFAAEHILNHEKKEIILEKFFDSRLSNESGKILEFLYDMDEGLCHKVITKKFAENVISGRDGYIFENGFFDAAYLCNDIKIGIFEIEEDCYDSLKDVGDSETYEIHAKAEYGDVRTSGVFDYNGKSYTFGIAYESRFSSVSRGIINEYLFDRHTSYIHDEDLGSETIKYIMSILDTNEWIEVDNEIAEEIIVNDSLSKYISCYVSKIDFDMANYSLSVDKAKNILKLLKERDDFNSETEMMLSYIS